jgi:cell filamentation protein
MDCLRGRDADEFSAGLAWVWGETTALHPFRDVNTRSQGVFFDQLAIEAGWVIDWPMIDIGVFAHARTAAITGDESGLDALIRSALLTVEQAERGGTVAGRLRRATEARSVVPRRRTPAQLERALHTAIERLRALGAQRQPPRPGPPHDDRPGLGL